MTSGSVGQRVYIFSLAIFQMNLIVCFRSVPYFLWLRWILLQLHAVIAAALNSSSTNLPVKSFKFLSRLELSKRVGLGPELQIVVAIALAVWKQRQLDFIADANRDRLVHLNFGLESAPVYVR